MSGPMRAGILDALGSGQARARANIRRAMDGLVVKRAKAFPDPGEREVLRRRGTIIRTYAVTHLPALLEQLERRCTDNGIRVHWAETLDEANGIVIDILKARGAGALLKGKSMVSEEMGLNQALARAGIEPVETDLGEIICQLADEGPSHIIAPAVHKDRFEVAALFRERLSRPPDGERIEDLTDAARRHMRERFRGMTAGLTGVNFAVAETGTLCLVENEGNGRLCTTLPDVHIAVMGIEKVIPRLSDLPPLLTLLVRSATGQPVTAYVNLISGPRRPGERDGPREVHLLLLDNGRSRIHADSELAATLRCIRCGACMNHCPVYSRVGGRAYGTTYPGPIGSILEPQLQGLASRGDMAGASTLCGACAEVCPVLIPIPRLLNLLRADAVAPPAGETLRPRRLEAAIWHLWSWLHRQPGRYRAFTGLAALLRRLPIPGIAAWTRTREPPRIAAKSLHRLAREAGFEDRARGDS